MHGLFEAYEKIGNTFMSNVTLPPQKQMTAMLDHPVAKFHLFVFYK
jgi:hypothetical protein